MLVGLSITYKGKPYLFSSLEILRLAKAVIDDKYGSQEIKTWNLKGEGTPQDPYKLSSLNDWLVAIQRLSDRASKRPPYYFFNVQGRLIRVSTQDAYTSDFGPIILKTNRAALIRPVIVNAVDRYKKQAEEEMKQAIVMVGVLSKLPVNFSLSSGNAVVLIFSIILIVVLEILKHKYDPNSIYSKQGKKALEEPWFESVMDIRSEIGAVAQLRTTYADLQTYYPTIMGINFGPSLRRVIVNGPACSKIDACEIHPLTTSILMLAEGARNVMSTLMVLMMLDFVENKVTYGQDGTKSLTMEKVLSSMHEGEHTHIDVYGNAVVETVDEYGEGYHIWGGKFPMAHDGSFGDEVRREKEFPETPLKPVRQKEGSTLIRWLAMCASNDLAAFEGHLPDDGIAVIKATSESNLNSLGTREAGSDPDREIIADYFRAQLIKRMDHSDVVPMPHKTVRYCPV